MSMRRLETQEDGWRFASDVLFLLRDAGSEKCRINVPAHLVCQADPLIQALLELKERGTVESCVGFACVLTDAIGTRGFEPVPELYPLLEAAGKIRPHKVKRIWKRMASGGLRLAALALQREAMK